MWCLGANRRMLSSTTAPAMLVTCWQRDCLTLQQRFSRYSRKRISTTAKASHLKHNLNVLRVAAEDSRCLN